MTQQGAPAPVVGGGAVAVDSATGNFEVDGSYGCQVNSTVELKVEIGESSDTETKACGAA